MEEEGCNQSAIHASSLREKQRPMQKTNEDVRPRIDAPMRQSCDVRGLDPERNGEPGEGLQTRGADTTCTRPENPKRIRGINKRRDRHGLEGVRGGENEGVVGLTILDHVIRRGGFRCRVTARACGPSQGQARQKYPAAHPPTTAKTVTNRTNDDARLLMCEIVGPTPSCVKPLQT
jgi:hypothetical protein